MLRGTSFLRRCCLIAGLTGLLSAAGSAGCGGDSDNDSSDQDATSSAGRDDGPGDGGSGAGAAAGLPLLDGGVEACLGCVTSTCAEAQACLEDPVCVQGSVCAFTTCVAGQDAGADLDCWLGCFGNDPAAALAAFTSFTCVITNCGMDCAGGLGQ